MTFNLYVCVGMSIIVMAKAASFAFDGIKVQFSMGPIKIKPTTTKATTSYRFELMIRAKKDCACVSSRMSEVMMTCTHRGIFLLNLWHVEIFDPFKLIHIVTSRMNGRYRERHKYRKKMLMQEQWAIGTVRIFLAINLCDRSLILWVVFHHFHHPSMAVCLSFPNEGRNIALFHFMNPQTYIWYIYK